MRTRKLVAGAALAAFVTAGAFAVDSAPLGREIARDGARITVQGELIRSDGEWFVRDGSDLTQLHMGPYGYASSDALARESVVSAQGFAIDGHMAPVQLSGSANDLEFWHEARYPLWAGEGERRNVVDARTGRDDQGTDDARSLAFGRSDDDTVPQAQALQQTREQRVQRQSEIQSRNAIRTPARRR